MRFKSILVVASLVLLAGILIACSSGEEAAEAPAVEAPAIQQPNTVSAEAFVVPIQEADVAFEVGGRIVSVPVQEGDEVKAGDVLAQLDNTDQQSAVIEAEAAVSSSQANLAKAQVGITSAEATVAQSEAGVAEAEASLAKVKAGSTPEQIAQAQADLARSEAALAEILAGPTAEDIAQAEAGVETARANLANVLAGSRDEDLQAASAKLLQAEADVRLKQADYDKFVYGEPQVAEPFGVALQQATLTYEAAQADYNKVLNGATDEEVAISRAQLHEAEAALAKTKAGATPEQIAQAQATVEQSQAALAQLIAGATAEEIAISEAGVASAMAGLEAAKVGIETAQATIGEAEAGIKQSEAGLTSAQAQLAKTELKAPFDGVVGSMNIEEGEIAQAGASSIAIGDTSRWQIETDDLTEIDVVRIKVGRTVKISVDALPGEDYEGEVIRITPKSETKAGDVTYTVLIDITKGDVSRLMWGMTTFVDIEAGPDI